MCSRCNPKRKAHPFTQFPKSYAVQCFSIDQIPLKCLFQWAYLHVHFLGTTRLSIPNCISIASAIYAQLIAQNPYTLQCMLNVINTQFKKLVSVINTIKK